MATNTSRLDLVFAMDCTGSMASYIKNATDNIRLIVDEIVSKESVGVRLALVEYRDHPPQDSTFVTRVHSFTDSVAEAKKWLEGCTAAGGGDTPEAVADALNDVLNLSWNSGAVKICILISDAPPHGLVPSGDSFPSGCPLGHDPLAIARKMAEKHITLYTAGVEPPILPYRDFFMTLAHITGGQYVPMVDAKRLAEMIIGGVREEISLDRLMHNSRSDIVREMRKANAEKVDDNETATRLQRVFNSKNLSVSRMNNAAGGPSKQAEECYAKCLDMADIQKQYQKPEPVSSTKATEMDYAVREDQAVTIEQAKRVVQKAKNWDYSTEEFTPRIATTCKHGIRCYDHSSYHRARFSHPESNDETGGTHRTARNQPMNSHTSDEHQKIVCKHGEKCFDHTEYHRTKYSHTESDDHPTQRRQQTRSDHRDTHSRPTNSHTINEPHKILCKYGENCRDHAEYHRAKYSHPRS